MMWVLCCVNRIEHDGKITACRVFHAAGHIEAADGETMLLILNIAPVLRVKHLICTGESTLCDGTDVHFSHGDKTLNHVRSLLTVRL